MTIYIACGGLAAETLACFQAGEKDTLLLVDNDSEALAANAARLPKAEPFECTPGFSVTEMLTINNYARDRYMLCDKLRLRIGNPRSNRSFSRMELDFCLVSGRLNPFLKRVLEADKTEELVFLCSIFGFFGSVAAPYLASLLRRKQTGLVTRAALIYPDHFRFPDDTESSADLRLALRYAVLAEYAAMADGSWQLHLPAYQSFQYHPAPVPFTEAIPLVREEDQSFPYLARQLWLGKAKPLETLWQAERDSLFTATAYQRACGELHKMSAFMPHMAKCWLEQEE